METTLSDPNENKLYHSGNNANNSSADSDTNLTTPRGVKSLNVFKITGYVARNIVPINIFKENTHLVHEHNFANNKKYNYKR